MLVQSRNENKVNTFLENVVKFRFLESTVGKQNYIRKAITIKLISGNASWYAVQIVS